VQAEIGVILKTIHHSVECFLRRQDDMADDQDLNQILHIALRLDREISRQVAHVSWSFGDVSSLVFNPSTMEIKSGETEPGTGERVQFVVAPSLFKRGTSTGNDYDTERLVVPMEVSCAYRGRTKAPY
jgi:hypothetical protein